MLHRMLIPANTVSNGRSKMCMIKVETNRVSIRVDIYHNNKSNKFNKPYTIYQEVYTAHNPTPQ